MCEHKYLTCLSSPYAAAFPYRTYTTGQLLTAVTGKRKASENDNSVLAPQVYPAPLILPGDDIDCDPTYPPQSFREWVNMGVRNQVNSRRNVIYLAATSDVDDSVDFMRDWQFPTVRGIEKATTSVLEDRFNIETVAAYLRAFYHGLDVKILPQNLMFTSCEDTATSKARRQGRGAAEDHAKLQHVGLSTGREVVRIRARPPPPVDAASPSEVFPYPYQLNLNDLTDVSVRVLPSDAYALVLMTKHDLYESDDDDFCCGRAWGASRVAIVSSARYYTALDELHCVDFNHVWPASHCAAFIRKMSAESGQVVVPAASNRRKIRSRRYERQDDISTELLSSATPMPLLRALTTHQQAAHRQQTPRDQAASALLFRLCRTVSHELGHCFGLDHCKYKACVMQGAASVAEDMRQPPYLCPVCDRKVAWAITRGATGGQEDRITNEPRSNKIGGGTRDEVDVEKWEEKIEVWKRGRSLAVKDFANLQGGSFAGMAAWYEGMLELKAAT
ncbi:uncharacterized protein PV06_00674 [Exophiala oligosperma]|uniref:Uncharacterized protein n=1 Tax=Exophiala oligosperma TaxID=215243 RepID=A0A0D2DZT1_9EURO|nr:uncharacterized protein PV06_00674 [Exophiala oligosperma]KIW48045.1 hypothetical protein PV06_00674 [Exophiala oligosperma]